MPINVSLKAFNEVVSFLLERKHAFQESLFTAVSIWVNFYGFGVQFGKKTLINSVFVLFQPESLDVLPIR